MKIKIETQKRMKLTLDDLAKLLKLTSVTSLEIERNQDYRGEGSVRALVVTCTEQEERAV